VSHRPVVLVSGLAVGDYLLWNWSLNANHEVIALVSGLTLPPLALVAASLLVLTVMRLLARGARAPTARRGAGHASARRRGPARAAAGASAQARQEASARPASADSPSRRIAA